MSLIRLSLLTGVAVVAAASTAAAQSSGTTRPDSAARRDSAARATHLRQVTVTATRSPKQVFETAQPVTVLDSITLRERMPNTPVDALRSVAGLDVSGVGTNQARPIIRGQGGQRILLLEDGLRLNNSRRQQDFGELSALAGINSVERVEIVRGPSSVLYGTDAIGGVVNMISGGLPTLGRNGLHGSVAYRAGTADEQSTPSGSLSFRNGRFAARGMFSYRETQSYDAPAGSFGDITLDDDTKVNDTGVRDRSMNLQAGWDFSNTQRLSGKFERYRAQNAGFGYVDPAALGETMPTEVRIWYPEQMVQRGSLNWRQSSFSAFFADRADVTAYVQTNERDLNTDVKVPFTPTAGLVSNSRNHTDMATAGVRAELAKLLGSRHMLTYGVDWFHDDSENTDSSSQTISGFGPPRTTTSTVPPVPNATYASVGVFAQGDFRVHDRVNVLLGGRWQGVEARTRETPGVTVPASTTDHNVVVGTANLLVRITQDLNALAMVGRGFRAPNLVEQFFEGVASTGSGYQQRNPALEPETSLNTEFGLRYARGAFFAEGFVFRNDLSDGIRIQATGDTINRLPVFQNVNVDKLRYNGYELQAGLRLVDMFDLSANYTSLDSKNINDPQDPVGQTYASKFGFEAAYRPVSGRFSLAYGLRHQGEQGDIAAQDTPIGAVLPAFTVHSLRGSALLFQRGANRTSLLLSVENLTNELYSEFSNATFFRPEARRNVQAAIVVEF